MPQSRHTTSSADSFFPGITCFTTSFKAASKDCVYSKGDVRSLFKDIIRTEAIILEVREIRKWHLPISHLPAMLAKVIEINLQTSVTHSHIAKGLIKTHQQATRTTIEHHHNIGSVAISSCQNGFLVNSHIKSQIDKPPCAVIGWKRKKAPG
jgi:hypothetical protein